MARSNDLTAEFDRSDRESLPEGHARLVVRGEDVTITFEGEESQVRRRFHEELVDGSDRSVADLERAVDELPTPDGEDGLLPADEFYDGSE